MDFNKLTIKQLREYCKENKIRGCSTKTKKSDLVEFLKSKQSNALSTIEDSDDVYKYLRKQPKQSIDYNKLTIKELRDLCKKNNIKGCSTKTKKADLVEFLKSKNLGEYKPNILIPANPKQVSEIRRQLKKEELPTEAKKEKDYNDANEFERIFTLPVPAGLPPPNPRQLLKKSKDKDFVVEKFFNKKIKDIKKEQEPLTLEKQTENLIIQSRQIEDKKERLKFLKEEQRKLKKRYEDMMSSDKNNFGLKSEEAFQQNLNFLRNKGYDDMTKAPTPSKKSKDRAIKFFERASKDPSLIDRAVKQSPTIKEKDVEEWFKMWGVNPSHLKPIQPPTPPPLPSLIKKIVKTKENEKALQDLIQEEIEKREKKREQERLRLLEIQKSLSLKTKPPILPKKLLKKETKKELLEKERLEKEQLKKQQLNKEEELEKERIRFLERYQENNKTRITDDEELIIYVLKRTYTGRVIEEDEPETIDFIKNIYLDYLRVKFKTNPEKYSQDHSLFIVRKPRVYKKYWDDFVKYYKKIYPNKKVEELLKTPLTEIFEREYKAYKE